jgi:hypothetical protein
LVAGCGKKDKNPAGPDTGEEENYIPYQVGNKWVYQVSPVSDQPYTVTETVIGKLKVGSEEWVIVKDESSKNPEDFTLTYFELESNRVLMHRIEDFNPDTGDTVRFDFATPAYWLPIPMTRGATWTVFQYNGPLSDIPIISSGISMDSTYKNYEADFVLNGKVITEESVEAAGKTFQAYKVDFDYQATIRIPNPPAQIPLQGKMGTFWITPGVGIVKIQLYDLSMNVREVRILLSYTVQ